MGIIVITSAEAIVGVPLQWLEIIRDEASTVKFAALCV